jgi:hypothetical protein
MRGRDVFLFIDYLREPREFATLRMLDEPCVRSWVTGLASIRHRMVELLVMNPIQ